MESHRFSVRIIWNLHGYFSESRAVYTPLVFGAAFSRWRWLMSTIESPSVLPGCTGSIILGQCIQDDAGSIILGQCIQGDAAIASRKYWWWYDRVLISQLHIPKAELNTRNSTKRRLRAPFGCWVSGVQLGLRQMKVTNLSLTNNNHLIFSAIGDKIFKQAIPV